MTFRSEEDYRERPPSGEYAWPNNGEIYERLRCSLLAQADAAEAAGDRDRATDLRAGAAQQRKQRDGCWREHERRTIARRARRGAF